MTKDWESVSPTSCFNHADPNEMIFVLLARDVAAPITIRAWCAERVWLGKNKWDDTQIVEALECAKIMQMTQAEHHRHSHPGLRLASGEPSTPKPTQDAPDEKGSL